MHVFWIELLVATIYVLLGPVAGGVLAFLLVKGRQRMRLLEGPAPAVPEPPPRVSILVPAKDEVERIEACATSILQLDYPNLELILIDDRSRDGTEVIVDHVAARDPRVRAIHICDAELPSGWGGKSYALHRGVQVARGQWLLFVDADVQLAPDALSAAIGVALYREIDLISLFPRFILLTFWEKLLQPLAGAVTSAMFLVALTNNPRFRTAFANGQFMLVRRDVYEQVGGHAAIRGTLSEDTAIARKIKDAGFRPRLAWADECASVRMYDSFGDIFRGWSRNFFVGNRGRPWRIVLTIAFLLVCCFSAYAAIAWGFYRNVHPLIAIGGWGWIATGLVHWLLMTSVLSMIYRWSGTAIRYALLFPVGGAVMLAIFVRSLLICLSGNVKWRGTTYTRAQLGQT